MEIKILNHEIQEIHGIKRRKLLLEFNDTRCYALMWKKNGPILYDPEDDAIVSEYTWNVNEYRKSPFSSGKGVFMHDVVMNNPRAYMRVYHLGSILDNRKRSLHIGELKPKHRVKRGTFTINGKKIELPKYLRWDYKSNKFYILDHPSLDTRYHYIVKKGDWLQQYENALKVLAELNARNHPQDALISEYEEIREFLEPFTYFS